MMAAPMWALWLGLGSAFLAGFALRYWINVRRFERLNPLGLEQFRSYADLWSSRFMETLASIASNLLLAIGLGIVLLIAARLLFPGGG
jgi:hypothetical protein